MHIDTAGTYTLQYTATDSCGNETIEEREVIVGDPRTILYNDGTFIINVSPRDRQSNIALYGGEYRTWAPFNPEGTTDVAKYIFANYPNVPWYSSRTRIKSAKIGMPIQPTNTSYWYYGCTALAAFDKTNLDTSKTVQMGYMFQNCSALESADLSLLETNVLTVTGSMFNGCSSLKTVQLPKPCSNTVAIYSMFEGCSQLSGVNMKSFVSSVENCTAVFKDCSVLESMDLSNIDMSNSSTFKWMFDGCSALTSVNLVGVNAGAALTGAYSSMSEMFRNCSSLETLDLSAFNTRNVRNAQYVFEGCTSLRTIYGTTDLYFGHITGANTAYMFNSMSTNLVGGAGTVWSASNLTDGSYGHIDEGTANPGYFTLKV